MIPISIIVAIADNYAIGKDNQLLWHLSEDLKRFKRITLGHTVIMGRKTYLSIPKRPLAGRKNVVLTKSPQDIHDDCFIAGSIDEALQQCDASNENFVIGGSSIYEQFLPIAQKLYITKVHASFDADSFFPRIDLDSWEITESERYKADEKDKYDYTFITYKRKP